jgi:hypothetical protein
MTQLIFAITDAIAERSLAGLKQSQQPIYSVFAWVLVKGPATTNERLHHAIRMYASSIRERQVTQ